MFRDILSLTINEYSEKYGLISTILTLVICGLAIVTVSKVLFRNLKRWKSNQEFENLFGGSE